MHNARTYITYLIFTYKQNYENVPYMLNIVCPLLSVQHMGTLDYSTIHSITLTCYIKIDQQTIGQTVKSFTDQTVSQGFMYYNYICTVLTSDRKTQNVTLYQCKFS